MVRASEPVAQSQRAVLAAQVLSRLAGELFGVLLLGDAAFGDAAFGDAVNVLKWVAHFGFNFEI